jgi:hypothetical protein
MVLKKLSMYILKSDFIHFWSVTLVNTIKTTQHKPTQKIIFRQ